MVLAGCGDDGSTGGGSSGGAVEPSDPAATVAEPASEFTATLDVSSDQVTVDYTYVNRSTGPVLVVGPPPAGGSAYVVGDGDGVSIARRVFALPDDATVDFAQAPRARVVEVAAGQQIVDTFTVPRPFTRAQPFGDDLGSGAITLPDSPDAVTFCLGVVPAPYPAALQLQRGAELTVAHGLVSVESQHLFCSDPQPLD